MKISISVIVPVYNAENTLRQCVDSILKQEFRDFELILVDDGSKDQSPDICDEYALQDNRVKVFHKSNGGVSSARNLGLDNAKGEWITFIDSDDYISDGYLAGVVGREEDLLIKGYECFSNNGIVGSRIAEEMVQISDMKSFLNSSITDLLFRGPVFKFYKRSIISGVRFLHDMKIGEDTYFVFKYLAKCKSLVVLPKGKYLVRLSEKPAEIKYGISVDYAVQTLLHLKEAFDDLVKVHTIDKRHFLSYIGYFKLISKSDWQNDKSKWYGNKEVKALYEYVWSSLSNIQKCRLSLARTLKR